MNLTEQRAKYALVDEGTGQFVEALGTIGDDQFRAQEAHDLATLLRPDWQAKGLKLWLRVGQQK